MVIKASAASEIRTLVESLAGSDEVRREAAIARLAVIGARAVPHILAAYVAAPERRVRIALLRALEPLSDPRAASIAREALAAGGDLAVAAVPVLRGLLESPHAASERDSLDALVSVALDPRAERRLRLAAHDALQGVPEVRDRLPLLDPAPRPGHGGTTEHAIWQDALEARLPDDPAILREAAHAVAADAPLGEVHKLIEHVRTQEASGAPDAAGWRTVRGTLHQALALRGSRVAIADLRDTLAGAAPDLPASFISAAQALGDDSFLEPLAAAWAAHDDPRWRSVLLAALRAIAARERLTRRHASMRRTLTRWPGLADQLPAR
jgi:hypothetical protein